MENRLEELMSKYGIWMDYGGDWLRLGFPEGEVVQLQVERFGSQSVLTVYEGSDPEDMEEITPDESEDED